MENDASLKKSYYFFEKISFLQWLRRFIYNRFFPNRQTFFKSATLFKIKSYFYKSFSNLIHKKVSNQEINFKSTKKIKNQQIFFKFTKKFQIGTSFSNLHKLDKYIKIDKFFSTFLYQECLSYFSFTSIVPMTFSDYSEIIFQSKIMSTFY